MLDFRHHSKEILDILQSLPPGDSIHNVDYMTKVGLYDAKCGKCGFNRIEVGDKVFHNVQDAINYSIETGQEIIRTCEFPGNVEEDWNGNPIYPSLDMIVRNTCILWDK